MSRRIAGGSSGGEAAAIGVPYVTAWEGLRRDFLHAHYGGFVTRHRVVRKERDEQQVIHAFAGETFHRRFDGRILVTHRQLDRHVEGEISASVCAEMEKHLARCPACQSRCDSLQRTLALCRAAPLPEVPKAVQADVRRALQQFIELHE